MWFLKLSFKIFCFIVPSCLVCEECFYQIEGAIIFVDFTKAFDSLEWNFMLNALKHFGFNESFINWVKTLYTDIQRCVMNNGWVSEMFKNTRGIRQGFPLSALLFVFSVEVMASKLRNNKDNKGFQIKIDKKKLIALRYHLLTTQLYFVHLKKKLL